MRHGIPTACVCSVATLIVVAGLATAGPLDPPAGSIGPTYKTLSEVEPRIVISAVNTPGDSDSVYRITQPGSYYLTGNVDAPNDFAAIEVTTDNVTIDLNGFTVMRSASGTSNRSLIRFESNFVQNTRVRNGTVQNAGLHGIELGTGARVEQVHIVEPGARGITAFAYCTVLDCRIDNPGTQGVNVQSSSVVQRTNVSSSGAEGIYCSGPVLVSDCAVAYAGDVGIHAQNQSTVERCTVTGGASWGISAALNSLSQVFRNNTVYMNAGGGIRVYHRARVEGNQCESTGSAVPNIHAVGHGNRIEDNHCSNGTDAVKTEAGSIDNLVVRNSSVNATVGNGFANVPLANNQIGPVVTAAGTITTSNPWANFSR